jgi:hypothetical protein
MMRLPVRKPALTVHRPLARRRGHSPVTQAVALLLLVVLTACGGGQVAGKPLPRYGIEVDLSAPEMYAAALRMAALARVEARAGQDELAAEHFRGAYKLHETTVFLFAYGQAAERAKLFAEAHEAAVRALSHDLTDDQHKALEDNEKRLAALVPPGLRRVAILVQPEGARVELAREGHDKLQGPERIVIGSGEVFLLPGIWHLETSAKGWSSELRTFQVGGGEGDVIAIQLHPEDQGPALVGTPNVRQPKVIEKHQIPEPQEKKVENKPGPTVIVEDHPRPPDRGFLNKYGPVTTTILGVLAVGAGGWFGYQTQVAANNANAVLPGGSQYNVGTYRQQNADFKAEADANSTRATGLFIGGGVLLAAGTVWWLLSPSAVSAPAPELTDSAPTRGWKLPVPSVSLHGVSLAWTF